MVIKLPGIYAKFVVALLGQFLVYLQIYGWVWEPRAAATMAGVALAVLGVPNSAKPAPTAALVQPSVTMTPPPPQAALPPGV